MNDDQIDLNNEDYEKRKKRVCESYKPSDDGGYRALFSNWVRDFHGRWLKCESNRTSPVQRGLFYVKSNDYEERMNPDIAGGLTRSMIDAAKILNYETHQNNKNKS